MTSKSLKVFPNTCLIFNQVRILNTMKIFLESSIEELKHERDYVAGVARAGGSPRRLSVSFKETGEEVSPELAAYRDSLVDDYGIKPKRFSSDKELRDRFLEIVFATIKDVDPFFNVPTKATLVKYGLA